MGDLSEEGKKARQADVTVLVVDTDQQRCAELGRQLADEKSDFDIRTETVVENSVTRTETEPIDIVVVSTVETGAERLSLLTDLRATDQDLSVVLVAPSVGPDTARTVLDHGSRWLQTNGELAAMVPVIADLIDEERTTDRGALATVEETTDRYEILTQMLPDIVFITDYNSRMLFANDELERQTGLTVEDFQMEQESNPFIHPDDQERLAAAMGQFIESDRSISEPLDNRFIDKNGNVHWYTSRIGKVIYEGEPALQFVTRDITSRRGRGDDRSDERWHRSLLDRTQRLARIGGYEFDLQAENFLWTDGMYDLLELETKEDPDMEMLFEYIHPTDRERAQTAVEKALTDGDQFDLDVKLLTEAGTLKWARFQGDPLPAESDSVERLRGALVDITDRKEYEAELEAKRADLGTLNQVLRHDIRNDLQLMISYAEMLTEIDDEDYRQYAETVFERATHAVELTDTAGQLADVMLSEDETREPVALRTALEGEVENIQSAYPRADITVKEPIPTVKVFANEMLSSVFRNLLKNAVQHNDKKVPEVAVSAQTHGDTVEVWIADNGPGIPDQQKDSMFGKRQKGLESEGTGLGLYLVDELIDSFGGDIRITDNDPAGAIFVVELPITDPDV